MFETPKETEFLALDSFRAESMLGWRNIINFELAVTLSLDEVGLVSPVMAAHRQVEEYLAVREAGWLQS